MLLATFNVNSVRARLERLLAWLEHAAPDVVCLQETKVTDDRQERKGKKPSDHAPVLTVLEDA